MENNKRTLKINPDLFKLKKDKKNKSEKHERKKTIDDNSNKLKKELLKKVKDYHNSHENNNKNLEIKNAEKNIENDFENEFNKSLNFLQNLEKKNKLKKKNKTSKIDPKNIQINIDIPNNYDNNNDNNNNSNNNNNNNFPKYGNLKNGNLPTFKQYTKTFKNNDKPENRIKILLENNSYYDDLDNNKLKNNNDKDSNKDSNKDRNKNNNNNNDNNDDNDKKTNIISNIINNNSYEDYFLEKNLLDNNKLKTPEIINVENIETNLNNFNDNIPKKTIITKTKKYKIGKNKDKKNISVIIKNNKTQKNVKNLIFDSKNTPLNIMKNTLRQNNIIKAGSNAPEDVIKELYENFKLTGEDIKNTNYDNTLHNYLYSE